VILAIIELMIIEFLSSLPRQAFLIFYWFANFKAESEGLGFIAFSSTIEACNINKKGRGCRGVSQLVTNDMASAFVLRNTFRGCKNNAAIFPKDRSTKVFAETM
jgi:hypothetical protein